MKFTIILSCLFFAIGCGDNVEQVDQNGDPLPEGVTKNGDTFKDGEGRTCKHLTPCKNCEESCKPAGNPFIGDRNNQVVPNNRQTNQGSNNKKESTEKCSDLDVQFKTPIPTVVLLIDQSGSMVEDFGGGKNRLEAAYDALMDPADGLVQELQDDFRFGFSLYSNNRDHDACPELLDVRPSLNNFGPIDTVFSQAKPLEDTPTGDSIRGILRMYDGFEKDGPLVLLLATDGEPDSCADPDGHNDASKQLTLDAAKDAFAQKKVQTYILSVGTDISEEHLQEVANVGVGMPAKGAGKAPFFSAETTQDLKTQMKTIITNSRSCIFKLDGSILDLALIGRGQVKVNGKDVVYQDPNGYLIHQDAKLCFGSKQCLELKGSACESVKTGAVKVNGKFICVYDDPTSGDNPGGNPGGNPDDGETPKKCLTPGKTCLYSGDCCSGVCSGSGGNEGQCIVQ